MFFCYNVHEEDPLAPSTSTRLSRHRNLRLGFHMELLAAGSGWGDGAVRALRRISPSPPNPAASITGRLSTSGLQLPASGAQPCARGPAAGLETLIREQGRGCPALGVARMPQLATACCIGRRWEEPVRCRHAPSPARVSGGGGGGGGH